MQLVRMIYASRPTKNYQGDADGIAAKATAKNEEAGITGILIHDDVFFLQWIEGPRGAINRLYKALMGDDRHTDLEILDYRAIHVRHFPQWDMACIGLKDIEKSIFLRFIYDAGFDPYKLGGDGAVEFLKEVGAKYCS
mgnify:CR=1 FL=1